MFTLTAPSSRRSPPLRSHFWRDIELGKVKIVKYVDEDWEDDKQDSRRATARRMLRRGRVAGRLHTTMEPSKLDTFMDYNIPTALG